MSRKQDTADQPTLDRFPVALVVLVGNGTVPAGAVIKGYLNAGLGLWHTNRGHFLPSDVTYAQNHPCGEAVDVSVTNAPSLG